MPSIDYTPAEQTRALEREVKELRALVTAYISSQPEWLTTEQALRAAGIVRRETLVKYARALVPGVQQAGRITYKKEGTKCLYLKSSCIDYAQRKLGQSALNAA